MEEPGVYNVRSGSHIRAACFAPYTSWAVPNKDEVRAAMDRAGLDPRQLADLVGVSRKEVNRWTFGGDIPFACWVVLCLKAGIDPSCFMDGTAYQHKTIIGSLGIKSRELDYLKVARSALEDELLLEKKMALLEKLNEHVQMLHKLGLIDDQERSELLQANTQANAANRRMLG